MIYLKPLSPKRHLQKNWLWFLYFRSLKQIGVTRFLKIIFDLTENKLWHKFYRITFNKVNHNLICFVNCITYC